ncbi:MAG: lysine 2,3-aminomutase, partial [Pseudomonadota bacterium]|nr:lysine 2,3-aminomutase [Pseudomonadota bacterium]
MYPDSVALRRATEERPRYQAYNSNHLRKLKQLRRFREAELRAMEVVAQVLPFKANNYVVEELIDWDRVPDDPIFRLTFPQQEMLQPDHFRRVESVLATGADRKAVREAADAVRWELNPHPAGQEANVPLLDGERLTGIQHKYRETALFFPSQGQTCHAYCSFCFRWPQFVGISELKFAMKEADTLVRYLRAHDEITDLLFTGGDPMIMKADTMAAYVDGVLEARLDHLRTIRVGTKALSYWPYKFTSDPDADKTLAWMRRVVESGRHLAVMAHFNHPRELETQAVRDAIGAIRATGAQIRTQSPVLRHINDEPQLWVDMWREQVRLGCIPYYMFAVRDTGAQHYFGLTLARAHEIFRDAFTQVSGLARTVRGPSMSTDPGKVHVLGVTEVHGERVFVLQFLQGRDPD